MGTAMKKLCAVLLLGTLSTLVACGGKVLVDGFNGGGGGSGGSGGGDPAACPTAVDDQQVQDLVGKACDAEAMVCASNNGCGGCSVTCKNGVWASTDAMVCVSIGTGC